MRFAGRLSPDEFWDGVSSGQDRVRAAIADWPLLACDGWAGSRALGEWDYEDDALVSAGLVHGDPRRWGPYVTVHLTTGDAPVLVARLRATAMIAASGSFVDLVGLLAEEPTEQWTIPVNGRPRRFDGWMGGDTWFASAPVDPDTSGHTIVLEARIVEPAWVHLVRIRDVDPYLAGYESQLRRLRGEPPNAPQ